MTGFFKHIMPQEFRKISSLARSIFILFLTVLFIQPEALFAQVISNNGAAISVTNGIFVESKDFENNVGTLGNNGTINLLGNYYNAIPGITSGNGYYNIKGNWTNLGLFNAGTSVVSFNGLSNQDILHGSAGETFYILNINNPGWVVTHRSNVAGSTLSVLNNLNITAGTLYLDQSTSNLNVEGRAAVNGTLTFDNITTQTTSITDILSGSGIIDMSGGGLSHLLNLTGATNTIGTLATSPASSSTVDYNGTTQTVFPSTNYRNLTISNSGIKTLQGNSTIGKDLTISGGTFDLGTTTTTVGVMGVTSIDGSLRFNGTSTKTVSLTGDLSGIGSIDMSGSNLLHLLNLEGSANSIGTYTSGSGSTVDYIRNGDQTVFTSDFYRNLRISGSGVKILNSDITASGILTMSAGNINSNGNILKLTNSSTGAINRTAGTVIGKLQRAIGSTGSQYLYPVGSSANYNPLKLQFRNLTAGPLIAQFKVDDIGTLGLPLVDYDENEIWDRFTEGFWSVTAVGSMASTNFDVKLDYAGFTGIDTSSTIIKRTNGGNLELDGKNGLFALNELARDTLSGGISPATTDFAIGRGRPKIKVQPVNIDICEGSNAFFEVKAGGRGKLSYHWQVNTGSGFNNVIDGGVYSGATSKKLILTAADYSMNGYQYRCVIRDRAGNPNVTIVVILTVNKIPVPTLTPASQTVCNGVNFVDVVLGTSNNVTGTTFNWTRNNPAGITTSIPLSGSNLAIGDVISGSFTNTTNSFITVTFIVTPTGPGTTNCVGDSIVFTITVEPTVVITAVNDTLCNNDITGILPVSAQTTTNDIRYTWTVTDNPNITGETGSTGKGQFITTSILQQLQNISNSAQKVTYRITPHAIDSSDNNVCSFNFIDIDVWVEPTVVITAVNDTLCDNTATSISPLSGQTTTRDIRYTWTVTDNLNITGELPSTGMGQDLGTAIVQVLKNLDTNKQMVHYIITPWTIDNNGNNRCIGEAIPVDIWVDPTPTINVNVNANDTVICNNTDIRFNIFNGQITTGVLVYDLDVTYPAGVSGKFSDIADQTSTSVITDTLTNTSASIQEVYYTFRPLIKNAKQGFDCRNGVDTTIVLTVVPTLSSTAIPKTYIGGNNISCYNLSDGEINMIPTGGYYLRDYYYEWTKAGIQVSTLEDPKNLNIGLYKYRVEDILGCYFEDSILLTQPDKLIATSDSITDVTCIGVEDGEIFLTVEGGINPYYYTWTSYDNYLSHSKNIKGLRFGQYDLVIVDTNRCTYKNSYVLPARTPVVISPEPSIFGDYEISCFNEPDGYINIDVTGTGIDNSTWTYEWFAEGGFYSNKKNINSLYAATYNIKVTDSIGCEGVESIPMTQPDPISIIRTGQKYKGNYDISCYGKSDGIINLAISGGHTYKNYNTFSWNLNGNPISNNTQNISGLVAGIYDVVLIDTIGCQGSWRDTLIESTLIRLDTTAISDFNGYQVSCKDSTNSFLDLRVYGGDGQFKYLWTTLDGRLTNDTILDQSNLPAGNYNLIATDENSCVNTWDIQIMEPQKLNINPTFYEINGYRISCKDGNDGDIKLNPQGGVPSYIFDWKTSDGSGLIPINENQSNLTKGNYTVQVSDANNCSSSWVLSLNEPDSITSSIIPKTITCYGTNNGAANLSVQGGVSDYSYVWSTGAGFPDTIAATQDVDSLFLGTYYVKVIDSNGCIKYDSATITQPLKIDVKLSAPALYNGKMISCYGKSDANIYSTVSGGYIEQGNNYKYEWLQGGETSSGLNNVQAGKYTLSVKDDNDCIVLESIDVIEPQKLITEVYKTDPTCFAKKDGTITLIVQGGTPEYFIDWDGIHQTGQSADSIGAGTYNVNITDLNGCRLDTSATLVHPDSITITKTFVNPSCPDKYNGYIDVTDINGGTPPYALLWNNNIEGEHLQDLGEGRFILQLIDNQRCLITDTTILKGINNICLKLHTAFTPNGDGVNDTWEIEEIELYPDATIEIFNRWGERIFYDNHGYSKRWDGTYKGRELPIDSYHYVIDLKNRTRPITGNVTILR